MFQRRIRTVKRRKDSMWTFAYTTMTLGSVVSYMGNAVVSFTLSLLVLDLSESVLLYGIYLAIYHAAKIAVPLLAGPVLDRISRKKAIYILDFCSFAIYLGLWFAMTAHSVSLYLLASVALLIGMIDGAYSVAFYSLYPTLVKKEHLQKAYSVYSMLETLTGVMVPVAAVLYNLLNVKIIFLFSSGLFLAAAILETLPHIEEPQTNPAKVCSPIKRYFSDLGEGMRFLGSERALLALAIVCMVQSIATGAENTILLPFFRSRWENGYYWYILISGAGMSGYFMGGLLGCRLRVPVSRRRCTALALYIGMALIGMSYLFLPIPAMVVLLYLYGFMTVTAYTMRIAASQRAVETGRKARYTGSMQMLMNSGILIGELGAGALAGPLGMRGALAIARILFLVTVIILFVLERKPLEHLYTIEGEEGS